MSAKTMVLALVILVGVVSLGSSQVRNPPDAATIEGTWIIDLAIPGDPPGIQLLATYMRDGGIVADGNNIRPTLRSAWHGTYVRVPHGDFAATSVRWNYDSAGNFTGRTEFNQAITMDPHDGFSGRAQFLVFDVAGNLVRTREGTFQATRMGVRTIE
jgi:hypothetical protein